MLNRFRLFSSISAIALGFAALALAPAPAEAGRFNSVIITGASGSDDGFQSNHLKDGQLWLLFGPPNPASGLDGRASNGLMASERFYLELGFSFANTENYAIGGAQTGSGFVWNGIGFPIFQFGPERNWNDPNGQITRMLARHGGVLDPRTLYYINIGANDFNGALLGHVHDEALTRANLVAGYTRLIDAGARTFFVLNQYTFGVAPMPLNTILPEVLAELRTTRGIEVIHFDSNALSLAIAADPGAFGFNPVTAGIPCYTGGVNTCTPEEAGERFNWDGLHLTAAANALFGRAQARLLIAPETQGAVLLPAFGHMTTMQAQMNSRLSRLRMAGGERKEIRLASASADFSQYDLDAREGGAGIFFRLEHGDFRRSATALEPLLDGDGFTATLGVDFDVAPSVRLGAAASYGDSTSTIAGRDNADMRSYAASLYGMWMGGEAGARLRPVVDATASAARLDVETSRDVGFAGLYARADTRGWHYAASARGGIDILAAPFTLTPELGLAWQDARLDGYTETGALPGFNLVVGKQQQTSLTSEAGARLAGDFGGLRPSLGLHWLHEFESASRTVTVAPDSFPGLPFTAATGEVDRNYGRAQLALAGDVAGRLQFEIGYRQSFLREDWRERAFRVELRMPFR